MGQPLAKQGDTVVGLDTHIIMVPSPGGPVPTPTPHPFNGILQEQLSSDVIVNHMPVAVVGSVANNTPPHIPMGGPFQTPPDNRATISQGSSTVFANHKPVARNGDPAQCCNDPVAQDTGNIVSVGTVLTD
ncbi:MAG: PAAR domain-containing protein [Polyangiaceae bacterium]